MESSFSHLSSMSAQLNLEDSCAGYYSESSRLALYALLNGGTQAYQDFLSAEGITDFLSEEEVQHILGNRKWPSVRDGDGSSTNDPDELTDVDDNAPSTYCPLESDVEVPDLDLGWPEARLDHLETNIHLLFHPPRQNTPSIKTLVRKYIREAKMVIAIAMDMFTDVDIFRDLVEVSTRGVVVYLLLDELRYNTFLNMAQKANVPLHKLWNVRIRTVRGQEYRCQSGAKFYGAMQQKFMLVDCHTALYGSYSFMWSYERINLSMALLITGRLVTCFDEEFRRLFARSTVPASLAHQSANADVACPLAPSFSLYSSQLLERSRSFDTSQLKAIRGRQNIQSPNNMSGDGVQCNGALGRHGLHLQRSSVGPYAALQQRMYSSMRQRTKDAGEIGLDSERENTSSTGLLNNLDQMRRPSQDEGGLPGQPSFLSSSELSLHKWRIEAYLMSDQIPADSVESLDCISVRSTSKSSLTAFYSSRPNLLPKASEQPTNAEVQPLKTSEKPVNVETRMFKPPEQPATNEVKSLQSPFLGRRTITSVYSSLQKAKENDLVRDLKRSARHPNSKLSDELASSVTQHTDHSETPSILAKSRDLTKSPDQTSPQATGQLPSSPAIPPMKSEIIDSKPPPSTDSEFKQSLNGSINAEDEEVASVTAKAQISEVQTNFNLEPTIKVKIPAPQKRSEESVNAKAETTSTQKNAELSVVAKTNIMKPKELCEASVTTSPEIPVPQKLSEAHRSMSHSDLKIMEEKKAPQSYDWQEPPLRTTSVKNLAKETDLAAAAMRASNLKRLRPFSESNKTRLSLLDVLEEKDASGSKRNLEEVSPARDNQAQDKTTPLIQSHPHTPIEANVQIAERGLNSTQRQRPSSPSATRLIKTPLSPRVITSPSTSRIMTSFSTSQVITSPTPSYIKSERVPPTASPLLGRPLSPTWSSSRREEERRKARTGVGVSPRTLSAFDVVAEGHRRGNHGSMSSVATVESVMSNPGEGRYGIPEVKRNKVYSRFEHFLSVERRHPDKIEMEQMNAYATDKRKSLFMGTSNTYSRYQTQTDNRFGKFIQRMGNMLTKNK